MKNLISLIALTLILSCCSKKDDEQPLNPISQLPPATQSGANTAGCLVNGVAFLPKGSSQFGPILSCFYQQDQDGFHLGLSITEKGSTENKSIGIATNSSQLLENTTYNLLSRISDINNNYISNFGQFIVNSNVNSSNQFYTSNLNIGELKITKLNTQQRIISGTFWYDAINPQGEIVKIRDGRFDMRYVN